jgi:hypothetical protein
MAGRSSQSSDTRTSGIPAKETEDVELECHLPREGLLTEVNIPIQFAVTNGTTELISEATSTASADTSGTNAFLHLLVDEALYVGSSGEHLDT